MKKILAIVLSLILLLYTQGSFAQCSGGTSAGTAGYICVGGTAPSNAAVPQGGYYLLNVISGLTYNITSTGSGITVRNADGSALILHSTTTTLTFTATYSGLVRVYNCRATGTATLTYAITGGSNNIDNAAAAGTDVWIEHFYDRLDNVAGAPTDANAFTRYIGTGVSTKPVAFTATFGGANDVTCLDVYSQGTLRTTLLNYFFAVRYRMLSTLPKGVYLADMAGDDGIRLTVDGTQVFNRWIEQGVTTYTKEAFRLTGNSNLLFEYYESVGGNEATFQNLSRVSNSITTDQTICVGGTLSALNGTNTLTAAPVSSDARFTITYQWQQSSDSLTFTNISAATAQNYTPTVTAAGVYYFRRLANVSRTNDGMPSASTVQDESNVVKLSILATPVVTLSGGTSVCQNVTAPNLTFTNPQNAAITVIYKINGGANQTLNIAASATATVAVPTATVGAYTYAVNSVAYQAAPACTNTAVTATATVNVRALPNGSLAAVNSQVCKGQQVQLKFTASQGTGPFTIIVSGTTYTGIVSGTAFNVNPNITNTTTFNLTKITDANGCVLQNP
ncbi:hypothetical protein DBR32_06755 [Taibaiella sp. KBW10]|uniref:hypothetical protein n=1 Tax=Taibaiella sp. KBW10 TaxID=2153357 RepID=UPI000F5AD42B|nr:hypothetical protein [Taibaiella sp. KBW10]RQO31647.1 hypothetical protein DBR32_06755 [Taibaiella sp. KBW10]